MKSLKSVKEDSLVRGEWKLVRGRLLWRIVMIAGVIVSRLSWIRRLVPSSDLQVVVVVVVVLHRAWLFSIIL